MSKRTRTGCITCRKRRLKCDETKPTCIRCQTANFVCEGYEQPRLIVRPKSLRASATPSSPSPERRSPELPWRHTNWREEQLPIYHHFVTQTVYRLFRADHAEFWRDEVAKMSFGIDLVYEALLCISAAHRTSLLACEDENSQEAMRLNIFAMGSYGKTLRLLADEIGQHEPEKLRPILIVLLLLTYFECFMENSRGALRHLWAAIQVYRRYQNQATDINDPKMAPIQDVLLRLDFIAQKLVPYSRTSVFCGSDVAFSQTPFWNRPPVVYPSSTPVDSVKSEAHSLIRLVSGHNSISGVVWGCWYGTEERAGRDTLLGFCSELLLWKSKSPATFESCPELESIQVSTLEEVAALPIPPRPIICSSDEAAINLIMFNSYLGCASGLVNTTDEDHTPREIEIFKLAYQTLAICQGMLTPKNGESGPSYKPGESIDIGVTIYLFDLYRRCFSVAWQEYTISLLHEFRREGLSNGHTAANALKIMKEVEICSHQQKDMESSAPLGHIKDRLIPMLMPRGEEELITAYYLRYGISGQLSDETIITLVAKASWNQDNRGKLEDLKIQHYDMVDDGCINLKKEDRFLPLRQSVENGWHGSLSAEGSFNL